MGHGAVQGMVRCMVQRGTWCSAVHGGSVGHGAVWGIVRCMVQRGTSGMHGGSAEHDAFWGMVQCHALCNVGQAAVRGIVQGGPWW